MKITTIFLFILALSFVSVGAAPILWSTNGHYYEAIGTTATWANAKALAENMTYLGLRGHLATITSLAENQFITSNMTFSGYFVGGFQNDGTAEPLGEWQWVTGEAFSFSNWGPGEPNDSAGEDALHFRADGLWNDINKGSSYGYIVEYEAVVPEPGAYVLCLLGILAYRLFPKKA